MIMKKIKKTSWLLLIAIPMLLLTVAGCKKFLDRKPLTATLDDLHQGGLEAQSLGLYSTLQYAGFSTLPWLDFNSIRDDDAQKGSSLTDGAEINAEFETFNYTKDDWGTNTYWNDHFYMINLTNKELFTADSLKLTDDASLVNIGEACFFRAYSFFDLVKAYGEVPLINFYFTNAADGIKPKATVDQIYAQIDADLNVAINYLPLNWDVAGVNRFPGRLTRGAAHALAAQAHIFRQHWDSVIVHCNAVINSGEYQLLPNFPDIWKDGLNGAGKNSTESIFEMQVTIGENGTNYHGVQWGTCQNVRQGGATNDWNLGWGWNTPTQKLVDDWDNTDPRKVATILYSGQFDGGSGTGGSAGAGGNAGMNGTGGSGVDASSDARKTAVAATSAPTPSLPAGTRARIASRCLSLSLSVMAVAMKPGAIEFAVTPRLAYSPAIDLIMPIMPALVAV
jgi:hypothetical protein